ncbi:MAG: hypothetical protein IAA73_10430 [Bacteroidetes bacterium]|uniref:Uncharacterized protein n=1 Tax=Candidatus Gallipaludibacter merdavium TaxID=2840839 RepID=A0A9D9N505_9BACT|nr:hypothetical protein [Candidatus Gallipaludibacter merdavium]
MTAKTEFDTEILRRIENGEDYAFPGELWKEKSCAILWKGYDFKKPYLDSTAQEILKYFNQSVLQQINGEKYREFTKGTFFSCGSSARLAMYSFTQLEDLSKKVRKNIDYIKIDGIGHTIISEIEKALPIYNTTHQYITNANLDVVLKYEDKDIYFIEVKCHEIFDSHRLEFSNKYSEILKKKFEIDITERKIQYKDFRIEKFKRFDFKQLICHLYGISQYDYPGIKHLIYMFYFPKEWQNGKFAKVFKELNEELVRVKEFVNNYYPNIEFGYFFAERFNTILEINQQNHSCLHYPTNDI